MRGSVAFHHCVCIRVFQVVPVSLVKALGTLAGLRAENLDCVYHQHQVTVTQHGTLVQHTPVPTPTGELQEKQQPEPEGRNWLLNVQSTDNQSDFLLV